MTENEWKFIASSILCRLESGCRACYKVTELETCPESEGLDLKHISDVVLKIDERLKNIFRSGNNNQDVVIDSDDIAELFSIIG